MGARDVIGASVLLCQFGDEVQIASGQIRFDPAIDALVQLGVEVVLPVARFPCGQPISVERKKLIAFR